MAKSAGKEHKKSPLKKGLFSKEDETRTFLRTLAGSLPAEFVGELLDAARRIHHALLAGIRWMRVGGNVNDDNVVLDSVNRFLTPRFHGRTGQKAFAGRNIDKSHRPEGGLNIFFHSTKIGLITPGAL